MAGSIGKAALILTADASKLHSGLDKAGSEAKSKVGSIASSLKGGFVAGLGIAAAQGVVDIVQSIAGKFGELSGKIDGASKAARSLGTDTATFMGWQHAADLSGVSVEQLETALGKFRQSVSGPMDEALYAFADKLQGVSDPGERAKMAVEAFGKAGVKMLPMLEGGSAGIKDMVEEAKRLGIALDDVQGQKIEAANDAITRVKASIAGVINRVLVAMAPVVEKLGAAIVNVMTKLAPLFDFLAEALSTYWEVMIAFWGEVFNAIWEVIKSVGEFISEIFNLSGVTLTARDVVLGVLKAIGIGFAYVWDTIKVGAGVIAYVASFLVEGFGKVVKMLRHVFELAKELPDAVRPSWLDKAIDGVIEFDKKTEETAKKMRSWGEGTWKNFGKSADDVRKWFQQFDKEKDKPKPKGAAAAPAEEKKMEYKAVQAMVQGSREAISVEARFRTQQIIDKDKLAKEQLNEAKKANEELKKIAAAVAGGAIVFGAF
jgi:hypothetical protein